MIKNKIDIKTIKKIKQNGRLIFAVTFGTCFGFTLGGLFGIPLGIMLWITVVGQWD